MIFRKFVEQELNVKVEKEFRFCDRKFRFDYAIPEYKIAIEVEGGIWTNGRHVRGQGFINDMEKYNLATIKGWRVLRVQPDDLLSGKTLSMIKDMILYIENQK